MDSTDASRGRAADLVDVLRSVSRDELTGVLIGAETDGEPERLYFIGGALYLVDSDRLREQVVERLERLIHQDDRSRDTVLRFGQPQRQEPVEEISPLLGVRLEEWDHGEFRALPRSDLPVDLYGPLPTERLLAEVGGEGRDSDEGDVGDPDFGDPEIEEEVQRFREDEDLLELLQEEDEQAQNGSDARPEDLGTETRSPRSPVSPAPATGPVDAAHDRYIAHFGLRRKPFTLTPDPDFLFLGESHAEALAGLELGVLERRGLIVLTGEVGTGKTTLLYSLLSDLDPNIQTAYIANTKQTFPEMLSSVLRDFGIEAAPTRSESPLQSLNDFLATCAEERRSAVIVVDEAQNLSDEILENFRLLLNYETFRDKLLQVVLVGQPELEELLGRPEVRQLTQRVAVNCSLSPLSDEEARSYISHRLAVAGGSLDLFEEGAIDHAIRASDGIPRLLNIYCHNALLFAYGSGRNVVTRSLMREAVADQKRLAGSQSRGPIMGRVAIAIGATILVAALIVLLAGDGFDIRDFVGESVSPSDNGEVRSSPERSTTEETERIPGASPSATEGAVAGLSTDDELPAGSTGSRAGEARPDEGEGDVEVFTPPAEIESEVDPGAADPGVIARHELEPGDRLYFLMQDVYGEYDEILLDRLFDANPHLDDPRRLRPGQEVSFPARAPGETAPRDPESEDGS